MDSAHDIADYFTGVTDRGELWLELVEIDSEDERVTHELAVPVLGERLDWSAARWADCGHATHAPVSARHVELVRGLQAAGKLPSDDALYESWESAGGPRAYREWLLDMSI